MLKNIESVKLNKYWCLESTVANHFNRMKGKIYNLIEASVSDKTQQSAIKGLIKGFANEEYNLCLDNMRYEAREAGFLGKEEGILPQGAEPLETMPR